MDNKELMQNLTPEKLAENYLFEKHEAMLSLASQQPRTFQKKAVFLINLQKTAGNIARACRLSGIKSRKTVYNWMANDEKFNNSIGFMNMVENDMMEDSLRALALRGHLPAIKYFLDKRHPDYKKPKRTTVPPKKKEDQWEKWERLWREQEERDMKELERQEEEEEDEEELHESV